MNKKILSFVCAAALLFSICTINALAADLEDGAYTVGRKTSYANPETGKTVDGGTNIALGDSMCDSIVDDELLVEQINGKTYITIGIGLMSNIENVRIQLRDESGSYKDAELTLTGSCERNGDTCNHYRFEAYSADGYISPIFYVTPMGRDVQFFVVPDVSSAKAGTGSFVSEMIPAEFEESSAAASKTESSKPEESSSPVSKAESSKPEESSEAASKAESSKPEESSEAVSKAESSKPEESSEIVSKTESSKTKESSSESADESSSEESGAVTSTAKAANESGSTLIWIVLGVIVLAAAGVCVWFFCFFKKRKD